MDACRKYSILRGQVNYLDDLDFIALGGSFQDVFFSCNKPILPLNWKNTTHLEQGVLVLGLFSPSV